MTETVPADKPEREEKPVSELQRGTWVEVIDMDGNFLGEGEVLHVETYNDEDLGRRSALMFCQQGFAPDVVRFPADMTVPLLTDAEVAERRAEAERAQKIADIRALADFLEASPGLPLNRHLVVQVSSKASGDVWDSGDEGVSEVRGWADIMGVKVTDMGQHVEAVRDFGSASYKVVAFQRLGPWFNVGDRVVPRGWEKSQYARAGLNVVGTVVETKPIAESTPRRQQFRAEGADWCGGGSMWNHSDGYELAPAEPAPAAEHYEARGWKGDLPGTCGVECACGVGFDGFDSLAEAAKVLAQHIADPTGQDYGRADTAEQDDPTPVSGARVAPHVGAVTERGLVDETPRPVHFRFTDGDTLCGLAEVPDTTGWTNMRGSVTCQACANAVPLDGC